MGELTQRAEWTSRRARGYKWADFESNNLAALVHGAHSPRVLSPLAEALQEMLLDQHPVLADLRYRPTVHRYCWAEAEVWLRRAHAHETGLFNLTERQSAEKAQVEARAQKLWERLEAIIASSTEEHELSDDLREGRRIRLAAEARIAASKEQIVAGQTEKSK